MPHFSPWIDVPIIVLTYAATLSGTLYWVFCTEQENVPKTGETTSRLAFRLSLVTGLIGVCCYFSGIAFWAVVIAVAVLLLATYAADSLGVIGLPVIALGFFIKEYVLGFPELVLSPPEHSHGSTTAQPELHKLVGRTSTTTTPLRPQGDITIDGKTYPAASDGGTMIESGVLVEVIGSRNGNLLVRETKKGGRLNPPR